MVWYPLKDHIQSRPLIHLTLLHLIVPTSQNQLKHLHCIPSTNQWTLQKEKPMGRTILVICDQHLPG